ncbi:hypothetical protein TDB9533_01188 [Thalassocella blandensis]|nr:hypothetical protein TDB9533_01188 [Thalassocella blandensis]
MKLLGVRSGFQDEKKKDCSRGGGPGGVGLPTLGSPAARLKLLETTVI